MAGKLASQKRLRRLLPTRNRVVIIALICSNAVTVLTLYNNIPGLALPAALPQGSSGFWDRQPVSRKFEKGHGLQGYVFYRSHRTSESAFVALGLSALALHNVMVAEVCRWKASDGSLILGKVTKGFPGDTHQMAYEVALLWCRLDKAAGASAGGQLSYVIDGEEMVLYQEKAGSKTPAKPAPPFKHQLAYCGSPMYGHIHDDRLLEWVEYHRVTHSVDFFHLYDAGGVDPALRQRLKPYVNAHVMDIADVREISQFETWLYAQLLVINDCAYRTRATAQWALFMDLDEFLFVTAVPHSLQSILTLHQGTMWITFGSMFYWTDKCTHSANVTAGFPQPWEVERLVFRQADVHCKNIDKYKGDRTKCLEYYGHRKYIADPRQVEICGVSCRKNMMCLLKMGSMGYQILGPESIQIHKVVKPETGGVHTSTNAVHLNHFRGINTRHVDTCKQFIYDKDWIPLSWARDFTLAEAARRARLRRLTG